MYESLKKRFTDQFGTKPGFVFSAPGRTEIGGNHTDHQHGCVLAGAVNLDTVAAVARSERGAIRVLSEGYPLCEVFLSELEAKSKATGWIFGWAGSAKSMPMMLPTAEAVWSIRPQGLPK